MKSIQVDTEAKAYLLNELNSLAGALRRDALAVRTIANNQLQGLDFGFVPEPPDAQKLMTLAVSWARVDETRGYLNVLGCDPDHINLAFSSTGLDAERVWFTTEEVKA